MELEKTEPNRDGLCDHLVLFFYAGASSELVSFGVTKIDKGDNIYQWSRGNERCSLGAVYLDVVR